MATGSERARCGRGAGTRPCCERPGDPKGSHPKVRHTFRVIGRRVVTCHSLLVITRLLFLAGAVIASAVFWQTHGTAVVIGWLLVFGGYLLSLWLHPHYNCRRCKGTGAHRGLLFTYAHRRCSACGGQGRHRRLGTLIFSPGRQTWAEKWQEAAGQRRNRPQQAAVGRAPARRSALLPGCHLGAAPPQRRDTKLAAGSTAIGPDHHHARQARQAAVTAALPSRCRICLASRADAAGDRGWPVSCPATPCASCRTASSRRT